MAWVEKYTESGTENIRKAIAVSSVKTRSLHPCNGVNIPVRILLGWLFKFDKQLF